MQIIKHGTPSERKWKGRCNSCKSEAIATESELKNIHHDDLLNEPFSREVCPVCGIYGGMLFYPIA